MKKFDGLRKVDKNHKKNIVYLESIFCDEDVSKKSSKLKKNHVFRNENEKKCPEKPTKITKTPSDDKCKYFEKLQSEAWSPK